MSSVGGSSSFGTSDPYAFIANSTVNSVHTTSAESVQLDDLLTLFDSLKLPETETFRDERDTFTTVEARKNLQKIVDVIGGKTDQKALIDQENPLKEVIVQLKKFDINKSDDYSSLKAYLGQLATGPFHSFVRWRAEIEQINMMLNLK